MLYGVWSTPTKTAIRVATMKCMEVVEAKSVMTGANHEQGTDIATIQVSAFLEPPFGPPIADAMFIANFSRNATEVAFHLRTHVTGKS